MLRQDAEAPHDLLARTEQMLEGRVFRLAARGWTELVALRRRRREKSRVMGVAAPSSPGADGGDLARATAQALERGAYETAITLASRLEQLNPRGLDAAAQAVLVEALVMQGLGERATAMAGSASAALSGTPAGLTVLELSGLGDGRPWLAPGKPNMLGLSRRVARGELDAPRLLELLAPRARHWLRLPELCLLLSSALIGPEPPRAMVFLSSFLARHGLPPCHWRGGEHDVALGGIRFDAPAAVDGPLVSVLVASRNASGTLAFAVDSLLAQSYRSLEVLVADDDSTDGSVELLRQRYAANPRVRLFRSTRNQGAYNVRNALAKRARGELVTFHDADDLALPMRIARQVRCLRRAGAQACIGNWLRMTADGRVVFFKNQKASRLSMVSLMLTRSALDVIGPFRSAVVGADLELYTAMRERFGNSAVERIAEPLILGLWSSSSATRSAGLEALEDGYRSPARRAYSEAVCAKSMSAPAPDRDAAIVAMLRDFGNYREASELVELDA